jgi:hypothetical protein
MLVFARAYRTVLSKPLGQFRWFLGSLTSFFDLDLLYSGRNLPQCHDAVSKPLNLALEQANHLTQPVVTMYLIPNRFFPRFDLLLKRLVLLSELSSSGLGTCELFANP